MKAKSAFLGAVFGLLIGGPAMLLSWTMLISQRDYGSWMGLVWVIVYIVWGAILGAVLLRKRV